MMQMTVLVHSNKKKSKDNKKKYETKRIRKFQPAWQKEFDWVNIVYQDETNKMYCSTCRKYAELPKDMFFSICGVLLVLILRSKMKYEVYRLPLSIVVVAYFWTSSFVVRTSKIHIVLVRRDK